MRNFSLRSRLAARVDWWPSKWKPNKHSKVRRFNIVFTFARNHMPSACLFGLENFSPISWFNERACGDSSAIEWGYTSSVRSPFGSIASEKKNQFLVFLLIIITIVSRIRYHDSRPRFSTPSIEEICAVVVCFDSILSRFTPPPFNLARELFALIRFNIRLHFLLFDGWQILKCILGNLGGARSGPWLDVRKWWRFFFSFSLMSENHVQPLPSWSGAKSRQLFSFFSHRRVIGKCG